MRSVQFLSKWLIIVALGSIILSFGAFTTLGGDAKALNHDDSVAIYKTMAKKYQFGKSAEGFAEKSVGKGGERIDPDSAKIMIAEFLKDTTFPIQNLDGERLKGFYIKRDIFDTLINNKKADGIRLLFAKHTGAKNKAYTLVIYGTKKLNKTLSDDNDPTMGVYENIDPCPNNCGNN